MIGEGFPGIRLWVEIPSPTPEGGWKWIPADRRNPAGEEHAADEHELTRIMLSYGVVVATMFRTSGPPRFRLVARGARCGNTVAVYVWKWAAELGRYAPDGEPWVVWDVHAALIEQHTG
jgi:hypothetical protein